MSIQQHTISHSGSVLERNGYDAVTTFQNQTGPRRMTEIIEFECPEQFERISFVGNRDAVRFEPRTKETKASDGSGSYSLDTNIQAVAGEPKLEDQPYPAVEAYQNGSQVDISSIDYATGDIELASDDGNNDVHFFPILTEGGVKLRGINNLGQTTGPLFPWTFPVYRWHDFDQDKRGTEVNLSGSIQWGRQEALQIMLDSPDQIVWEDSDYPDAYVSTLEMDVEITF